MCVSVCGKAVLGRRRVSVSFVKGRERSTYLEKRVIELLGHLLLRDHLQGRERWRGREGGREGGREISLK